MIGGEREGERKRERREGGKERGRKGRDGGRGINMLIHNVTSIISKICHIHLTLIPVAPCQLLKYLLSSMPFVS